VGVHYDDEDDVGHPHDLLYVHHDVHLFDYAADFRDADEFEKGEELENGVPGV
jgi:hypothetical protein